MTGSVLDIALAAWSSADAGLSAEQVRVRVRGFAALVRGIAERGSVCAEEFARDLAVDASAARSAFASFAPLGLELDESGRIVGAALTTRKTPHRMRLKGRDLYAWCALDALFIPGLAGERAEVFSTCPETGDEVRLVVEPDGVKSCTPASAVLSVVLPAAGVLPRQTGPASPT